MPAKQSDEFRILHPGENCWRIEAANRVAPLIDTAAYFEAFTSACTLAEKSIFIIGWDFDRHEPAGRGDDVPTLEQFLQGLLERNKDLHIYLLIWDYSMIYAAEREWFQ
jgi:phosphatidylserine/phosphatidylglycerophosphate/cardiolipin synthase-like enzyme